jgi:capsular polysaccharide biosynthesis protein
MISCVKFSRYFLHEKGFKDVELRAYWAIFVRRFWIIALIVGVVALYSAYQYYHLHKIPGALKTYQSTVTVRIGLLDDPHPADHNYADYVSASESLADEFTTGPIFTSPEFTQQVVQQIQSEMPQITQRFPGQDLGDIKNASAIAGSLSASRAHSLVTLSVNWNTPAGAWAIADATGKVSQTNMGTYLDYVIRPGTEVAGQGQPQAAAQVVGSATDPATIPGPSANKPTLLLVLIVVALVIGLALAFLIEYLDDRIRSVGEVENLLQLPVYGEIPAAPAPGKERARAAA